MQIIPSAMKLPASKDGGEKHYSFLSPLDDITVPSAKLNLASSLMLQTEKEASIQRLSAALHTLAGGQNSRQLPVLPVAALKDGALEPSQQQVVEPLSTFSNETSLPKERIKHANPFKHIPKLNMGESFCSQPIANLASLTADVSRHLTTPARSTVSKSPHKRTSSEAGAVRPERQLSARLSRPISMYSVTRRQTMSDKQRPTTSTATTDAGRDRKRSITYNDQRCSAPSREKESSRPTTATQSPRRRFKIPSSFRDLNFRSERRRRILQPDSSPPPPLPSMKYLVDPEGVGSITSCHITMQQALETLPDIQQTHALLHNETESKNFTRECMRSLALKPDPPKVAPVLLNDVVSPIKPLPKDDLLLGPRLPVQQSTLPNSHPPQAGLRSRRRATHSHRFSEADSISSSILDYDWPQPEAYRTTAELRHSSVQDQGKPRPDSGIGGLLNLMNVPNYRQGPFFPPPSGALPPTPVSTSQLSQKQPYYHSVTHQKLADASNLSSYPAVKPTPTPESKSRLTSLAEAKGLCMNLDAEASVDTSSSEGEDAGPVLTSPLRLRSQRSNRSVRIDSLRRKHLSVHGKDGLTYSGSDENFQDIMTWARRGSAPESVDSCYRLSKQSFHRRCASNDKSKRGSQCLSPLGRHSRRHSRSSTTAKTIASRVQKVTKPSSRSSRTSAIYPEVLVPESRGTHDGSRRHSRQHSAESQPSTTRSTVSTAFSTDTDVTLPSPIEDETMTLPTIAGKHYPQSTLKARSSMVLSNETRQDKRSVCQKPVVAPKSYIISNISLDDQDNASLYVEGRDGIGRSQRDTSLRITRTTTERDLRQDPASKKRQAQAQLAHDLQFELDQLEQMKRVYRAMHSARDRDRASGQGPRSYAQLLDDDRFHPLGLTDTWTSAESVKMSSRRTSHIIAKIEADLEHSPPKHRRTVLDEVYDDFPHKDRSAQEYRESSLVESDVMPPPIVSPIKTRSTSPPQPLTSAKKPRHAGFSLFPSEKSPPKSRDVQSPTFVSSSTETSFKSSQYRKPKSPSSTISSFESRKGRKRYSLVSIYNATTPQYSPSSSTFSEYRTPGSRSNSRQQHTPPSGGRELHIAATITSPHISQDLNLNKLINTSSRIDQVIDTFPMAMHD